MPVPADLSGAVDLHVHAAPDVRPRKATMLEVARAALDAGMRAVLFKSHHEHTAGHAALVNEALGHQIAYGGVVLNRYVGGLNPDAVEAAAGLGARMVWMPTFTARHHHRFHQEQAQEQRGVTVLDGSGRLSPAALDVLDAVAARGLALATGHLSPDETTLLVPEARRRGVHAVVVTHPETGFVGVPLALQQQLAATGGVYFDRCRNMSPGAASLPTRPDAVQRILAAIRAVGVETTIVSTDFGQPDNPLPVPGLRQFHDELLAAGITQSQLDQMSRRNPARVLNLEGATT